jgi:hypothetical protein
MLARAAMATDDASLAELAAAVDRLRPPDLEDIYLEQVRDVWWSCEGGRVVGCRVLRREGAAARFGQRLATGDGLDRLDLARLLGVQPRSLPVLRLAPAPAEPDPGSALAAQPTSIAAVRWRWSWGAVLRAGLPSVIRRPELAELTLSDGHRRLVPWAQAGVPWTDAPPGKGVPAPGAHPVLLAPAAAACLLHELVGHPLESDLLLAGDSPWRGGLGDPLLSFPLDVDDDPTRPWPGAFGIDDEGVPARPRPLLRGGIVTSFIADRAGAAALGVEAGSARRGSVHAPPRPRLSNLVASAPSEDLAALRRQARIEVHSVAAAASAGPIVQLEVRRAHMLHRGVTGRALARFDLRGDLMALAGGILAAALPVEASAEPGWCRKAGDVVPTGAASPWLLVTGLEVR